MAFTEVSWTTNDVVSSAKLVNMINNDKTRADGSWVTDGEDHGHILFDEGSASCGNLVETTITFNKSFNSIPQIQVLYDNSGEKDTHSSIEIREVTTSGFKIYHGIGGTKTCYWNAVGI